MRGDLPVRGARRDRIVRAQDQCPARRPALGRKQCRAETARSRECDQAHQGHGVWLRASEAGDIIGEPHWSRAKGSGCDVQPDLPPAIREQPILCALGTTVICREGFQPGSIEGLVIAARRGRACRQHRGIGLGRPDRTGRRHGQVGRLEAVQAEQSGIGALVPAPLRGTPCVAIVRKTPQPFPGEGMAVTARKDGIGVRGPPVGDGLAIHEACPGCSAAHQTGAGGFLLGDIFRQRRLLIGFQRVDRGQSVDRIAVEQN